MHTDAELLQGYVRKRDERAFADLVQRHVGVVYGAALRRTGGRAHLAEEIAQKVFADLARKAAALCYHPALAGWLHRSTRYAALDAVRAEQRGKTLAQTLATMSDTNLPTDAYVEWEKLRPLLDEALDQLKEPDREAMLLRFFEGLSFAEVGCRLHVSENAARMRTERALDKLRGHLGRRGLTSTTVALGLVLANQAVAAAPAGLAASVTSAALAAAPAAGGIVSFLFMSKITLPAITAAFAAGITALVWTSAVPTISAEALGALRTENARLMQGTAPGADDAAVAAIANEFAGQTQAIAQGLVRRQGSQNASGRSGGASAPAAVTPRGYSDRGTATAQDAAMTFAWAGDICDPDVFGRIISFDPEARAKAIAVLATMPEAIRAQYPTPEAFYGLLLAASCLEGPPPSADIVEKFQIVELSPGRVSHRPPGGTRNDWVYQQTPDGWRYVLPLAGVEGLPSILNSETLAKLAKP